MEEIPAFDPLEAKTWTNSEVAANALKKEIENILSAYFGWFDPFCELIQNALDSIEERGRQEKSPDYKPQINIIIDLDKNSLTVSDNGTGLTEEKYRQFLAPAFSFKSGKQYRGHKGIGATYLAYGFNYIKVATKTDEFKTIGKMVDARSWLFNPAPAGNPKISPDSSKLTDDKFDTFDRGVSIILKFDKETFPSNLGWLSATTAEQWKIILQTKTGLGAVSDFTAADIEIKVVDKGTTTEQHLTKAEYYWPHQIVNRPIQLRDLMAQADKLFQKHGRDFKLPSKLKNIECLWDKFSFNELIEMFSFEKDEQTLLTKLNPTVYFAYMYTAEIWNTFNDKLGHRKGVDILAPGVQISANNMPQGEILEIPLSRYTGRQNQIMVIIHFEEAIPDPGRKGFQQEVVSISKVVGRKIIEHVNKYKTYLRVKTGVKPDLKREHEIEDWKKTMEVHQNENPLTLKNEHFFRPLSILSILSEPTREQDVIALFNQLIAGGVIRGIRIMSTNERFTYDGMYRICHEPPSKNHIYDENTNPLGVLEEQIDDETYTSHPKILEYKKNLDALIEDIEDGSKNSNDISLVVVWDTGEKFKANYTITSLINSDNLAERQYHGVTHVMTNLNSGQREMDLIVLSELINFLNSPKEETKRQEAKYG